ncbi:U3 small nucleolar RNA-associated protein NOL7 [Garra rufa]|uniref:U3 small nucleolar RNA-associated protein NOL7 n=1 Tax=Garra rufa TaxID=137080 RepID=UPI003CCE5FD6
MSELTEPHIESSDDELPEEVAFDASKSAALKTIKDALESVKREKNILKEKRKKRQQLFQEQKKRKLLPQELLEEFDTKLQKKTNPSIKKRINKKVSTTPLDIDKDKEQKSTPEKIAKSLPESYKVTRVKDESASKTLQQKAADFIQSRLYGPGTQRTTNAALLSLNKKRGASQGAAVNFANVKLSAKQRGRIARTNKHFIQHTLTKNC